MRFSLRVKGWVLFASIMPMVVALIVSATSASKSMGQLNQERLIALRDTKQARLTELFDRYRRNLAAVAFAAQAQVRDYGSETFHASMTSLNTELEFYDIFLVNPAGDIVYTVAREADYQTNLLTGPYASSGLGKLFASIRQGAPFAAQDFAPYAPSNNEPAAFIGEPMVVDGQTWMVASQMSIDGINALMNLRSGMGETGETYLVGPDFRMRSDSYLDPAGHSIKASFAGTVEKNGVTSDAAKNALSGDTGFDVVIDYNGNPVLSAYAPVEVYGYRWAVLAEIDEAEALIPIYQLLKLNGFVLLGAILAGFGAALIVTRAVMKPLGGEPEEMAELMDQVARGQLKLDISPEGATGLKGALMVMVEELTNMIMQIQTAAEQLSTTAEELSVVTEQAEQSMVGESQELEQAVTAVNEMATSVHEVASNATHASESASIADRECQEEIVRVRSTVATVEGLVQQVHQGSEHVGKLAEQVRNINSVLDVIRGVAEQTNLLALNAAIEAARAGESGRGFAVVADEVRNLAQRTQVSTQQIEDMVNSVNSQSGETVDIIEGCKQVVEDTRVNVTATGNAIERIVVAMRDINEQTASVGSATEEQAQVSSEIDQSLIRIRDLTAQTVTGAHQTAQSSSELAEVSTNLRSIISFFKV